MKTPFLALLDILAQDKVESTIQATVKASFATETFLYGGNFYRTFLFRLKHDSRNFSVLLGKNMELGSLKE